MPDTILLASVNLTPLPRLDSAEIRHVADCPGYAISSDGRAFSCKMPGPTPLYGAWRELARPLAGKPGLKYPTIQICKGRRSQTRVYVHRLVLEAFVGPCPAGMEACHGDGNPLNPALDNLRWDTPKRNNSIDKIRNGTTRSGERNHRAKLRDVDVIAIRGLAAAGARHRIIADEFGVSQSVITTIVNRTAWRHVS